MRLRLNSADSLVGTLMVGDAVGEVIESRAAGFVAGDIARIFLWGLEQLKIDKLFAIIGGSLGGGIAWEMAAINPNITEHLIPVASDWKSTDWKKYKQLDNQGKAKYDQLI